MSLDLKEDIILVGISFFLMLIFTAGVITINAWEDKAGTDYEIKKVELNWKDGIEGVVNQLKSEITNIQKEGIIVNIIPEVKGQYLSQFLFSRTEELIIITSRKGKNERKFDNIAYFNRVEDILQKLDPSKIIIVPLVDQCGVLQIFPYGCTKYFIILW